jgi:hypothetical protein
LIEKLGELAENRMELDEVKQLGEVEGVRGVHGFTTRTGLCGDRSGV